MTHADAPLIRPGDDGGEGAVISIVATGSAGHDRFPTDGYGSSAEAVCDQSACIGERRYERKRSCDC